MAEVWSITSGKGGVGKTFITSGIGISLTQLRKKVLIIDFDLTVANLHTITGYKKTESSILNYLMQNHDLSEIITPSGFSNLDIIMGLNLPNMMAELSLLKVDDFMASLKSLNYDVVVIDLGVATSNPHLEMMSRSDKTFLVTNCEPSSVDKTMNYLGFLSLQKLHIPQFKLMLNFCRSHEHRQLGQQIEKQVFAKYRMNISLGGLIHYDNAVWQSAQTKQQQIPNVFAVMPYSSVCHDFYKICKQYIDPSELRAVS